MNHIFRFGTIALLLAAHINAAHAIEDDRYAPPATATPQDFIAVFKEMNGANAGLRKGHTRGVCASGEFVPSDAAKERFTTPLFSQASVSLVLRFSMGGGNANADERVGTRGVGVAFNLEHNQQHRLAGLTTPLFSGSTPNHFLGLLQWNLKIKKGEATAADLAQYFAANPSMAAAREWNRGRTPSTEYTNANYYGIHAFWAETPNQPIKFRWQLVPESGAEYLSDEDIKQLPSSFLSERLQQRLEQDGEVSFLWQWMIGNAEDPTHDPTVLWPEDRERVTVGRITVTKAGGDACTALNFDPMRLAQGIRASDDPVLPIRSAAYAISFGQRTNNR